ncbi:MAG TPA: MFS transporter, partial [Candidatus Saccharimonadales bacterium]|nr:MFS transporter [Candidatus Saccharimonadales bacterium]
MTVISIAARRAFSSLRIRNFRLFFFGQMISVSGIWMQRVAQAWLVLELTGSGTAIGLVTACQFLPMLFLAPMGGLIADRFDKRRLLFITQGAAGILALVLGLLVSFDLIRLWMVYLLAGMVGLAYAVDTPARQSFVLEMVGPGEVTNAVTLNSVLVNMSRVIGPSLAGVLIVTTGLGVCFLVNAGSYLAILAALALMRTGDLQRTPPEGKRRRQVREGLLYVWSTPALLVPLLMMAVIGTLAYEFQVSLPLVAKFTFGGDARTYGLLTALMGGGAVVGGLFTASRRVRRP